MHNPYRTPWNCPTCGPSPDPPQFIYDTEDDTKRIGWICHQCNTGEDYSEELPDQPRPIRWRSIDDDGPELPHDTGPDFGFR